MRTWLAAAAALGLIGACSVTVTDSSTDAPAAALAPAPHAGLITASSANVVAAVGDERRPQEDRDRDAARKPADMLAFAGVAPGMNVADVLPGGGYFTRLFAVAVTPGGHVYAVQPPPSDPARTPPVVAVAANYEDVEVYAHAFAGLDLPRGLDMVWTSQNYHDMHIARFNIPVADVNRAVFAALKPGGVYIVLDHSAKDGSGVEAVESLHRIDQAFVRAEVEAAGFVYDGESNVLRNAEDTRELRVFDPAIRGHTDQFVMRFRKPG